MSSSQQAAAARASRTPEQALAEAEEPLTPERLERLVRFAPNGLPVVTMYLGVPPAPGDAHARALTKADSLLHELRPFAEDRGREHEERMSLRGDVEALQAVVEGAVNVPETLAVASCSGAAVLEVVRLPRTVRDRIVVDDTPLTRPMLAVLDQYRRCLTAIVDRDSASAWELYLGQLRDAGPLLSRREAASTTLEAVNGRHDANRAEELEKRRFRAVAEALDDRMQAQPEALLVLGGHHEELPFLTELLAQATRERLAGTFAIDHTSITAGEVREQAQAVLDRHEREQQLRGVAEAIKLAAAGGHAAVGLDACLWGGSAAAVETLYVQDGAVVRGVVCDRSRWLALSGECCPVCGERMRETADVLDELSETVVAEGGSVHVFPAETETELSELLAVCTLRFELPPRG